MGRQSRRSPDEPTAARSGTAVSTLPTLAGDAPSRVVIEDVSPQVDAGRFPVKRSVGDAVEVTAIICADGHDLLAARLCHRRADETEWHEVPLGAVGNDRWTASFPVKTVGRHEVTVEAWIDRFGSWRRGLARKVEAGQEVTSELLEGAALVRAAAQRAGSPDAAWLTAQADALGGPAPQQPRVEVALAPALEVAMARHPDRRSPATLARPIAIDVEPERAAFGAWYECFPRSMSPDPDRPGTLADLTRRLDYVAAMGFDVLYLPPIHPIGRSFRKGRNNTLTAQPGDPGSPWGIGAAEGGHTAILPELGTFADFDALVARARQLDIAVALDLAFQCSPDHPWVHEHPEWFRHRP